MKKSERTHRQKSEKPKRREQIEVLKEEARALSGGKITSFVSPHCSPEVEEAFWEHVVSFEKRAQGKAETPSRSVAEELIQSAIDLPPHEQLDDRQLKEKLWEVIQALADRQYFLYSTNHLSDRELYQRLWLEELREDYVPMEDPQSAILIDFISSGSEEDIHDYLKYYADPLARQGWKREFPEFDMPEHEDPPHDRDRFLPRAPWEKQEEDQTVALN